MLAAIAIIPVVGIEAVVLWRRLRLGFGRALWVAFVANLVSTVAGALVALALDFTLVAATSSSGFSGPAGFIVSLCLLFGITVAIEIPCVRAMVDAERKPRAKGATVLANVASYALLAVAAMFVPPEPSLARSEVTEAINAAGVVRAEAAEQYQASRAFTPRVVTPAGSKRVRRVTIDAQGVVTAELAFPQRAELDGKTIVYRPVIRDGRVADWECHVPQAPLKYFPAACRQRAPEGK